MLDWQLAKTCNEIFTGECRYIQSEEATARYGNGSDMLTNPNIELLIALARYLEVTPEGVLDRPFKSTACDRKLPSFEQIMAEYSNSVSHIQKRGDDPDVIALLSPMFGGHKTEWPATAMNDWICGRVAERGRSLLSAHFLGRVVGSRETFVSTIVYPEHICQDLRLAIQDSSSSATLQPDFRGAGHEFSLDDEQTYTFLGNICAGKLLFTPEKFQENVEAHLRKWINRQNA